LDKTYHYYETINSSMSSGNIFVIIIMGFCLLYVLLGILSVFVPCIDRFFSGYEEHCEGHCCN